MISIIFHRDFEKKYIKLSQKDKQRIKERIRIFKEDIFNPILNNHPLEGKYKGYRSINITGDLRIIYKLQNINVIIFVAINNHSNLYK